MVLRVPARQRAARLAVSMAIVMLACAAWLAALAPHAYAQDPRAYAQDTADDIDAAIVRTTEALGDIRETIANRDKTAIDQAEARLRDYLARSRNRLTQIERQLTETQRQLDLLPPPPNGPGEANDGAGLDAAASAVDSLTSGPGSDAAPSDSPPAEASASPADDGSVIIDPVAERRGLLTTRRNRLQRQLTAVNSNILSINDLLAQISAWRVEGLYRGLATRGPLLVSPGLWASAGESAGAAGGKVGSFFASWGDGNRGTGRIIGALTTLAIAGFVAYLFFGPLQQLLRRFADRFARGPDNRFGAAGLRMLARLAPGLAAAYVVIEATRLVGLLPARGYPVVMSLLATLAGYLAVSGFGGGLLRTRPGTPPLDAPLARRVQFAIAVLTGLVLTAGLAASLISLNGATVSSSAITTIVEGCAAAVMAMLYFLLCRRSVWVTPAAEKIAQAEDAAVSQSAVNQSAVSQSAVNQSAVNQSAFNQSAFNQSGATPDSAGEAPTSMKSRWRFARRIGRALSIIAFAGAVAGYAALSYFAATRILLAMIIFAGLWFIRLLAREAIAALDDDKSKAATDAADAPARYWLALSIDMVLLMLAAPIVLLLVGVSWPGVRDMAARAFLGFEIAGVSISIARILFGVGLFTAIVFATRLLRASLEKGVFAHARIDRGVSNSLNTLIGYVGLIIAFMVGVTALGFDLSNLAIIAGALSVGIGFGLQSIVNNFVSGLILLFERPIKTGDWIVTPSGEGFVKKISVRSTEIETFDRSSIIIPNSELIASPVTNWTHRNALGRIIVPVGVSYDSDPEQVMKILKKCAADHPLTLRYPEPVVVWNDFGASSLDFDVRAFLPDISKTIIVRTELRLAIFKALKEANIEIPFPQTDLHIRSGLPPARAAAEKPEPPPGPTPESGAESESGSGSGPVPDAKSGQSSDNGGGHGQTH